MALILVAALTGVFGKGPVSKRVVRSPGGAIELRYERMVRFQDHVTLKVTLRSGDVDEEGLVTLRVGDDYFGHLELRSVIPEPEMQQSERWVMVLRFKPVRAGEPVVIELRGKTEQMGTLRGSLETTEGGVADVLRFEQFAYP